MPRMKPIAWVLIGGLVIIGLCLFAVFGGGIGKLLGGGSPRAGSSQQGDLGRMYVASEVDQRGCPVNTTTQFYADESIFVGVGESEIPSGTEMFARLLRDGRAVEDTEPVQANRDMQGCVWFEFQPAGSAGFEPGDYEAQLYVNGNAVESVDFEVADEFAGGGGNLPGTGSDRVELGRLYTTSEVDQNGCPVDDLETFYPDEPVYISINESYIPAGTEVFARLVYDGQVIEDTDPIVADRDMQTCVWFEFQASQSSGGLDSGNYTAEIYVNGDLADTIDFVVD